MKKQCDYYKQTVVCSNGKCKWFGPWQIFRWNPYTALYMPDGEMIDESSYCPETCPCCGNDFAGAMDKVFIGDENLYVLYVWDEKKLR